MVRQQFLTGMPLIKLLLLLFKHRIQINYYPDVVRLLKVGLITSIFSILEGLKNNKNINKIKIIDAPIFIIGHWRSGTTYLQKILARDERLTTPTFYQCTLPHAFISAEKRLKPIIQKTLPATRIFDAMPFGVDEPFDDEFASLKLRSMSQMLHFVFPEKSSFNEDSGIYIKDVKNWSKYFMYFAKKLTYVTSRRLLFKSPMNTLRIKEILDLFPEAKFIYIYRRPEDVFISSLHQASKLFEHNELKKNKTDIREYILTRYLSLFAAYEKDKKLIPESQLIEVAFESLELSPETVIQSIYEKFNIKGLDKALPDIRKYLNEIRNYKKNTYTISEEDYTLVRDRWFKAYDSFSYKKLKPLM